MPAGSIGDFRCNKKRPHWPTRVSRRPSSSSRCSSLPSLSRGDEVSTPTTQQMKHRNGSTSSRRRPSHSRTGILLCRGSEDYARHRTTAEIRRPYGTLEQGRRASNRAAFSPSTRCVPQKKQLRSSEREAGEGIKRDRGAGSRRGLGSGKRGERGDLADKDVVMHRTAASWMS